MKVSCLCPTFNRPPHRLWFLQEVVESFTRQEYEEKELIILNDCPFQELVCKAPGVLVVNLPRRMSSLGEKRNFLASIASGDVFLPWDDDDISLPTRINKSLQKLGNYEYYNPRYYFFRDNNGLHRNHSPGIGHNCSIYRRSVFDKIGGYPHVSFGEDMTADQNMRRHGNCPLESELKPEEWFYIYRWGVSNCHVSAMGGGNNGYKKIGKFEVEPGRFVIEPKWYEPYDKQCEILLDSDLMMLPLPKNTPIKD